MAAGSRSTASRTCSATHPQVCLWPEQRDNAKNISTWATDAHRRLTVAGVTTTAQLAPRSTTPTSDE
ncbi:DUF7224 domain-containing protein, partial [Streptomyces sp. NRRL F-4711]|uniref:DUF7224 domain-containing protein n=1 Tax=Streptomyces sp. NRRL F-4711 TaxID=1519476 RepID=UPI003B63FDFE